MYTCKNGKIAERFPFHWTGLNQSHIEQLPFFHVYPGSRALMIGTAGCSMNCKYCSNAYIAKQDPAEVEMTYLPPERLISLASGSHCQSIIFGVNEPVVSIPSFIELSEKAHKKGLLVGCLTNGYLTSETAEAIAESCDFINISLKGMTDAEYMELTGVSSITPVLDTIRYCAGKSHIEITSPIVEPIDAEKIGKMGKWIAGVSTEIPWHVFRLLPEYKLKDTLPPDIEKIESILRELRSDLPYTYFGNYVGAKGLSTHCPVCGTLLMERINTGTCGGRLIGYHLKNGKCPECGRSCPVLGWPIEWETGRRME